MILAKHLTKSDVKTIINLIEGWSNQKLTWDGICESASRVVGKLPTRQSLNANELIKTAYLVKKKGFDIQVPRVAYPSSLKVAAARIAKLTSELDTTKAQNKAINEKFVQWQYNIYKLGIKEHQLNEPLPHIDRERTEKNIKLIK